MLRGAGLFIVFVFCAVAASGCGGGGGSHQSKSFTIDACSAIGLKLINGKACEPGVPAGVSPLVRVVIRDGLGVSALCTGTAIGRRAVLSAAHCFSSGISSVLVTTAFADVGVANVAIHPQFGSDGSALFDDVAVITTRQDLNVAVFPLLVSRNANKGEEAVVAGFGQTETGTYGFVQAGNAFVSDVSANHISTKFDGTGSNPCLGDSGGPLLLRQGMELAIAGVVSTGNPDIKNCGPGDKTLYTSISNPTVSSFILGLVVDAVTD